MTTFTTRASDAPYDALCPGRAAAQAGVPESAPSEDAIHGQKIHHAHATGDVSKLDHKQLDTYEAAEKIIAKAVTDYFGPNAFDAADRRIREVEIRALIDGAYVHIGHPDVIFRYARKAMVADVKSLPGEREASPFNKQIRDYLVLWDIHAAHLLDEIAACIVEPLVSHTPNICVYGRPEIDQAREEMFKRVRASHAPNAPRVAGEFQCKFCRARFQCREYQQWAGSSVPVPRSIIDVPVAQWSPEQRATFCEHEPSARKWLDSCKAEMKHLLKEDSNAIPGWHLEDGNEVEVLTDLQLIYERLVNLGVQHKDFMECLRGVRIKGKLESAVASTTGAKGKSLKDTMRLVTQGASEKHQNEPSLERNKQ